MADIYLAISETPTVVTLTSAVIASSASSTVTVSNTVTVALDANSLSALENVTVTVGAAITGTVTVSNFPATQVISGTVTAGGRWFDGANYQPTPFDVTEDGALQTVSVLVQPIPAGTNRIGVVTIGGGTVTIGAGTAQIGSVTASISGTVPISISSVTVGNSVTIGSLPAISGTVTANVDQNSLLTALNLYATDGQDFPVSIKATTLDIPISGTVTANTFAVQGTAVTTSNFTSTTASTVLANYNATREVLTIFNEGAGNLHLCAGATCTTIAYQVRLSSGDYFEVPSHQTTITHSAVFATAGTARVTEVS